MSKQSNLVNSSQDVTVDGSGNVGIGTSSPSYPISVQSNSSAEALLILGRSGDDIGEIAFRENDNSTALGELQYRQDHAVLRHRVGDLRFATGGTSERMRIDSSGSVGIGKSNPTTALDVAGTVNATSFTGDGSALTGIAGLGSGQSWSAVTRSANTSYQNTSGAAVQVSCYCFGDDQSTSAVPNSNTMRFEVSTNNSTWVVAQHALLERTGSSSSYARTINANIIVPNGHYYRLFTNGSVSTIHFSELN